MAQPTAEPTAEPAAEDGSADDLRARAIAYSCEVATAARRIAVKHGLREENIECTYVSPDQYNEMVDLAHSLSQKARRKTKIRVKTTSGVRLAFAIDAEEPRLIYRVDSCSMMYVFTMAEGLSLEEMRALAARSYTGNHNGRRWPIRVPTAAGQPCRG